MTSKPDPVSIHHLIHAAISCFPLSLSFLFSRRKIFITFDFRAEFEVASVAMENVNTTSVSTNVHSNNENIKYKSKAELAASLTLALMAGIVTCAGFKCASRIGKQTQPERPSRNNNEDDIGPDNLILERNRRLSRVARLLEVVALKRDDSSLRQLAAEMRAAKLDECFSSHLI